MNQWLWVHLSRLGGLELELVAPTYWRGDLQGVLPFRALPELTCPLHTLPPTCAGEDFRMHLALYRGAGRLVHRLKPDLIYVDEEPYSFAAYQFMRLARQVGARCVFSSKQNVWKRLPLPFHQIERILFRNADGAIALTHDVASVLRAKGFARPIVTVPLAVEMSRFVPVKSPARLRELGLRPPVIGYIGRLTALKGVDLLLDALKRLEEEGVGFTGLIVGGGPEEGALRRRLLALGLEERVRMLPAVPHDGVAPYYACLDIAVMPSRTMPGAKEQFGRALIEAMACAVPVVGSDSGAIPEIIGATGGGLVFPEGDVAALTDRLRTLVRDYRRSRRLGRTGRRMVARLYSYEAVAAQLHLALACFVGPVNDGLP
jgi:glycosyltransferase involved in cell wall biosynthesis